MLPKKGRKGSMPQNGTNGNNCNGDNSSTIFSNAHLKDIGEEWLSYPKQVLNVNQWYFSVLKIAIVSLSWWCLLHIYKNM